MDSFVLMAPLSGWVTPLEQVPDPVFAERMLGDGIAIDPTNDTLFAPCDGQVLTVNEARHALSVRADGGAEVILHLGIDTVALGGEGIEVLVRPGDRVSTGDPLLKFDLDLLVQRAKALVTPIIVCQPECFGVEVAAKGMVAVGQPLLRVRTKRAEAAAPESGRPVVNRKIEVALEHGIHARPAARIVQAVRGLDAAVWLIHGDKKATASSPVAILSLGAGHRALITVQASGPDADVALDGVEAVLRDAAPVGCGVGAIAAPATENGALVGVAAAPGVAVGKAFWLRRHQIELDQAQETPEREREKLTSALAEVQAQMSEAAGASGSAGEIIQAQLALLEDSSFREPAYAAIASGTGAAAAWQAVIEAHAGALASSGDARIAERAEDLRDLEGRVLAALLGASSPEAEIPEGSILLAEELLPSQLLMLDRIKIAGIALVRGGPTSHAAILAAGMDLPMAVAFGSALEQVQPGTELLLDANVGTIELDPSDERVREIAATAQRRAATRTDADGLCRTADGTRVEVFANVGSLPEARAAVEQGAEGCGLLRTEFLFLDRDTPPSAGEQREAYQAIADAFGERPVIVRLLDVGGDKPAPYLELAQEENPALGVRGIRVGLAQTDLLETQIKAILSVTRPGRCKIMAPMVASLAELEAVAAIVERLGGGVELGVMIETPAAAITADLLAQHAAFLSIGSNDLTQYALAMDRGNAALAAGLDALHPAVLRLIGRTCDDAAKHDTPVAVCGALAADPLAVPLLIGLGVRELSVPPARIGVTKAAVAELSLPACRALAAEALTLTSAAAVRTFAAAFERSPR